jgi:hypothetical protein
MNDQLVFVEDTSADFRFFRVYASANISLPIVPGYGRLIGMIRRIGIPPDEWLYLSHSDYQNRGYMRQVSDKMDELYASEQE